MHLFTSCARTDHYDRHKGDASIAAAEAIGTRGLKRHMTCRLCAQPELWLKGSARWQKACASANVSSELKIHYSVPLQTRLETSGTVIRLDCFYALQREDDDLLSRYYHSAANRLLQHCTTFTLQTARQG